MSSQKREAPGVNRGANHSLAANGESYSTVKAVVIKATLLKTPVSISDPDYPLGCAFEFGKGRIIGCRARGLEAQTIQRLAIGSVVSLSGRWDRREGPKGKVRCFCIKKVGRV